MPSTVGGAVAAPPPPTSASKPWTSRCRRSLPPLHTVTAPSARPSTAPSASPSRMTAPSSCSADRPHETCRCLHVACMLTPWGSPLHGRRTSLTRGGSVRDAYKGLAASPSPVRQLAAAHHTLHATTPLHPPRHHRPSSPPTTPPLLTLTLHTTTSRPSPPLPSTPPPLLTASAPNLMTWQGWLQPPDDGAAASVSAPPMRRRSREDTQLLDLESTHDGGGTAYLPTARTRPRPPTMGPPCPPMGPDYGAPPRDPMGPSDPSMGPQPFHAVRS
jgi:hypothetical protein